MPFYGGSNSGFFYYQFDYAQKIQECQTRYPILKGQQRLVDMAIILDDIIKQGMDVQAEGEEKLYADYRDLTQGPKTVYFKPYVGEIEMDVHFLSQHLSLNGLGNWIRLYPSHADKTVVHFMAAPYKAADDSGKDRAFVEKDFGTLGQAMTKKEKKEFKAFAENILQFDDCRILPPADRLFVHGQQVRV